MPMDADFRGVLVCPVCGADYVSGVTECSDCHVPLVEPAAEPSPLGADAVEAGSTTEGAVARGWRDALTLDGIAHRVDVTREPGSPATYTLFVCEEERAWVDALAAIIEERPSLEARAAIRRAGARVDEAIATTEEPDEGDFDVPDLVAPLEVQRQIDRAQVVATGRMVLAILFVACGLASSNLWWGLAALIAAAESIRSSRVASARLAAWDRQSEGW